MEIENLGFEADTLRLTHSNISIVENEEQKLRIYQLRYEIYVSEMKRACKADHEQNLIQDELDKTGVIIGAYRDGNVIGTCRSNFSSNCSFENRDIYQFDQFESTFPKAVMFTTKLMVLKEYRKGRLFLDLCKRIYEIGLRRGAFVMIIDCNDHLVNSFKRLGFQSYVGKVLHPEYGEVTPMVLYNHDAKHLHSVGSPFFSILQKHILSSSESNKNLKEKINEL